MADKKRKRKPKQPREYFTKETELAIIEYITLENQNDKDILYKEKIEYGFFKLTENIIHTYKYYYTDGESIEDLQQEVIFFLLNQLHKFKPEKGAAYSYFGTIAKRYLINKNKKNYQKLQTKEELTQVDNDHTIYSDLLNEPNKIDLNAFLTLYIKYISKHLETLFPIQNERKIADAVLQVFKKRESLEIFNKKAIYIYIREITNENTTLITKVIKILKQIYTKLFNQYYEEGHINI